MAKLIVDSIEMELQSESGSTRGLNVWVLDENSRQVLVSQLFDTHSQAITDSSPFSRFC